MVCLFANINDIPPFYLLVHVFGQPGKLVCFQIYNGNIQITKSGTRHALHITIIPSFRVSLHFIFYHKLIHHIIIPYAYCHRRTNVTWLQQELRHCRHTSSISRYLYFNPCSEKRMPSLSDHLTVNTVPMCTRSLLKHDYPQAAR